MTSDPTRPRPGPTDRGDTGLDVVTGAFSYSGAAIAAALLATVAGSGPSPATRAGRRPLAVEIRPLDFDDQLGLGASLEGATTLYNTYWVRFAHGRINHDLAVANSRSPLPGRQAGRGAADRPRQHHPPERRLTVSLLPGQGPGRAGTGRSRASPTPCSDRPSSSAVTVSWSTTSPGCCGTFRSSPSAAGATTGSGPSTSTTWPGSVWPAAAERHDSVTDAVGPERPTFFELVELHQRGGGQPGPHRARAGGWPCRRWPGCSAWPCTTSCSRRRSTGPWPPDWPTPTARPPGPTALSGWLADHADDARSALRQRDREAFRRHRQQDRATGPMTGVRRHDGPGARRR